MTGPAARPGGSCGGTLVGACAARPWQALRRAVLVALLGTALHAAARADCPPLARAPTPEQVQTGLREARDRGLLWRFEKDGRVGWLYGTLHVGKLAWSFPGPGVTRALRAADTVALELDPSDPALAPALAAAADGLRLREAGQRLPPALRERLQALAGTACVAGESFAAQPLLLQALALTVLSARGDGLDPAFGQEAVLAGFARASGKALVSLETVQSQFDALMPADAAEVEQLLQDSVDRLESGQARRLLTRLAGLWAQGDLDALAEAAQWCECSPTAADQARMRRANDARNPALADRIAGLHAQGRRVFAAVGSLHMTGPQALPALLAARGFELRRIGLGLR